VENIFRAEMGASRQPAAQYFGLRIADEWASGMVGTPVLDEQIRSSRGIMQTAKELKELLDF
jgi:hypothetical protein